MARDQSGPAGATLASVGTIPNFVMRPHSVFWVSCSETIKRIGNKRYKYTPRTRSRNKGLDRKMRFIISTLYDEVISKLDSIQY